MHKRNAAIIASIIAALITLALTFVDAVSGSNAVGIFYFPAILLAVILSGGSRSPEPAAEWVAFLAYTLTYLILFLIVYVIVLELYLLRREAKRYALEDLPPLESSRLAVISGQDQNPAQSLLPLGRAIQNVELHRRKHWLLANNERINLLGNPAVVAADALRNFNDKPTAKGLIGYIHSQISKKQGAEVAKSTIEHLQRQAASFARAYSAEASHPP